jgi:hydrogenase maturation protease
MAFDSATCDTLVIGLGNPLRGDDGVGVRVAGVLAERVLPRDVEVVDGGTQGLGIVSLMEGRQRVILVDAADMGRAPGAFVRFNLDDVRLMGKDDRLSIHGAGLRDSLLLAQALGTLPDEVTIFGVQPAKLEWESALSPEVEASLPALVEAILLEASSQGSASGGGCLAADISEGGHDHGKDFDD